MVRFSKHTVASIEQGRRVPDWDFVTAADAAPGFTDVLHEAFRKVTREPSGLAAWFRRWAWYEQRAISLFTYECRLIPGLLQTETYARTLFANQVPLWDDEQIEAQLRARLERQRLLRERPHTLFSFVLEEHLVQLRP